MRPELVWRLFRRELKRPDVLIMLAAVVLAVASVVSLARFAETLDQAFSRKGASFLAADLVLGTGQPLDDGLVSALAVPGLKLSEQTRFSTMLMGQGGMKLASMVAVDDHYPLRGEITISRQAFGQEDVVQQGPRPGHLWLDQRLAQAIGAKVGDSVEVGYASLKVTALLVEAPDTGFNVFAASPPALMHQVDLAATQVIQPGSRVRWRYLLSGPEDELQALEEELTPRLPPWASFTDIKRSRSPIATALNRAERFLLLSSLMGVLLAAVAIGVAARRYCDSHVDNVALLKAMGASRRQVVLIYAGQLGLLMLLGAGLGVLAGFGLVQWLLSAYQALLPASLPAPTLEPVWLGMGVGLICTLAFAAWPLWQLLGVPPIRVWREDLAERRGGAFWHYLLVALALFGAIWLFTGELPMTLAIGAGVVLAALILVVVSFLMLWLVGHSRHLGGIWRLAIAGLERRRASTLVQLGSFTLALMLMLLIQLIKSDLLADWRASLPPDTPNYFVVNVAPEEVAPVERFLSQNGKGASDLYPVVRARLVAINGDDVTKPVTKEDEEAGNGRVGIDRELNLTWRDGLPPKNKLVAGQWWQQGADGQVSIESQVAERLGVVLGDVLHFRLGAREFSAPVTSIREVDWQSMQPNFFMIFSPAVLEDFPASYIASFHLDADQRPALGQLLERYPTLSLIDVDAIINQIRDLIEQVAMALEYVWLLVVASALLVLVAAVQASMDERRRDLGILRTLGAANGSLRAMLGAEFLTLGALAGLMAGLSSQLSLYLLQTQVLSLPVRLHWDLAAMAVLLGALGVALPALLRLVPLLRRQPARLVKS
ncbi:FtsX-like permease family protein [Gallaecimonas sp. GXIMD4217]|uniref:ABC transporter permease n=1 Tax=Gallaecimonas sp. GXIMD4217 TaxID=3131927 RepID=UPI00311ADC42